MSQAKLPKTMVHYVPRAKFLDAPKLVPLSVDESTQAIQTREGSSFENSVLTAAAEKNSEQSKFLYEVLRDSQKSLVYSQSARYIGLRRGGPKSFRVKPLQATKTLTASAVQLPSVSI